MNSKKIECEDVVQQQHALMMIKGPDNTSSLKCNNPVVVFAHGSSASSSSAWMIRWRNLLANALNAVEVVTFDYPYVKRGRKAAPPPEKLVGFHTEIVRKVAAEYPDHPLVLIGKSMGSKISCMVAAEKDIEVSAVVCLGYPLKATRGGIADEPLLQLTVPIMFVQGGNDSFCPLKLLEVVRNKLKAVNNLHVIENADHSFQIANKYLQSIGMTLKEAEESAAEAVAVFVSQMTSEKQLTGWPLQACSGSIFPEHVLMIEACVEDDAADKQKNQRIKSQPRMKKISSAKQKQPTQNTRKRKSSERILKNKLRKSVYDKDGRGLTVDKPVCIDD
ncbi:hypothetical protein QVD17_41214 [Tagetes erecta]|uniref:KANL3/Tex30 alpha/beta hydrolase-like domain-containing protein n=1 Tax=Tagetes erecta TaxID=13708 RepID=A0AAD8NGJ1_TARER|nr:hypothetical protein QVD17_41214 [Tagetes erecta]